MADALDSLLNDAVDLHGQAIDHQRILADVGIRQRLVTVTGFRCPSPKFG
jgi:hypothetical protein